MSSNPGLQRIKWSDKVTESGIELAGNAGVDRTGLILSAQLVAAGPNGETVVLFIVRRDDNKTVVVPEPMIEYVDEPKHVLYGRPV